MTSNELWKELATDRVWIMSAKHQEHTDGEVGMARSTGPRTKSVSVLLTEEEFERLQQFCAERGHKKSTLIALLLQRHLDEEQFQLSPLAADEPSEPTQ